MQSKQAQVKPARAAAEKETLDYSIVLNALWRFKWLLLALVVLGAIISLVRSRRAFVPQYESSATFTVGTQSSVSDGGLDEYTFYYIVGTTSKLAQTFPSVLNSEILQDKIREDMDLTYLPVSLSVKAVQDSNLFTLTARGRDPKMVYDVLLSAIKFMPDAAKHVIGNIRLNIISMPQGVPTSCYNQPNNAKSAVVGALVGLIIGLAWVVIYALLRKTIRSKSDIRSKLNMDTLGILPAVSFKKYTLDIDRSVLISNERVGSRFKEAMRMFRNTLTNRLRSGDQVVMLTSTAPGEGKSTVVDNLAMSLADIGKKVLVIDADLRKPSVNAGFGVKDDILEVVAEDEKYIITRVPHQDLHVLTFNTKNFRYWDLMNTAYLHPLLDTLRREYDFIVIDTPPCGLISDTLVIAQEADAAVYVILNDTIRLSRIRNSLANLASSDVRILGCVLNGASTDGAAYGSYGGFGYYKYGSRYGYRYGYGSRYGERKAAESSAAGADGQETDSPDVKD